MTGRHALDAAIHRKWIRSLEQLNAPRRIAHLYSELHTRLDLIGRSVMRALRASFTQFDMADMCGSVRSTPTVPWVSFASLGSRKFGGATYTTPTGAH